MKNVLRVFISSTFNDFRLERAVLQKFVFPELKNLAHEKGISFLPIDLRWGVPEEAQIDHRTMDICLSEVERSVTKPHPDFIVLSGDKYGWVPLPRVIEKEEFEAILEKLKELNEDISILKKWYELDENQIPVSYILKSRDEVKEKDKNYTKWDDWVEVENEIRNLLQTAVKNLNLDKEKKEKYFISATHEEFKTFLKHKKNDKDLKNHLISFIREFKDLDKVDEEIKKDLTDENKEKIEEFRKEIINNAQKNNLKILKTTSKVYEKLIQKYSKENREDIEAVFENINSLEEIKGNLGDEEFEEYLIEFANFIKERLKKSLKNIKTDFSEKDYHKDFKNFLLNKPFIGREEEIKEILEAIKKNDKVLIYGESGVGKSAIMAHIIDKLENKKNYQLIYRFSGATQTSSNLISLLNSLLEEAGIEIEENENLLNNLNQQEDLKIKLLEIGDKLNQIDKKIIIIIDAIDQLGSANIDELEWLPNNENIKIVISALKDENYKEDSLYYQKLQFFPAKIEIKRIKNKKELLSKLLEIENRTLKENQFEYVLNKKDSDKPLYLTIAKEELKFWRSKDELTDNPEEKTKRYLASTQKEIIKEFFNNLKTMHNIILELVDKTLGYISASQEHLSEELLLKVLSKDKELLSKIENKYHKNLTNELPPAVWSRFRWMIKDYIKEDESGYIKFYHREFEDIIDEFYNKDLARKLTLILEDLFPNENALIAHAHTLANRYNHKEEIEQNEYERVAKKLKDMNNYEKIKKLDYLELLFEKEIITQFYFNELLKYADFYEKRLDLNRSLNYNFIISELSKFFFNNKYLKQYYFISHNNLANLFVKKGQLNKSENYYTDILKINNDNYTQIILNNNLFSLLLYKNQKKAWKFLKTALNIIENLYENSNPWEWGDLYLQTLSNVLNYYIELNKENEILKTYEKCQVVYSNIRNWEIKDKDEIYTKITLTFFIYIIRNYDLFKNKINLIFIINLIKESFIYKDNEYVKVQLLKLFYVLINKLEDFYLNEEEFFMLLNDLIDKFKIENFKFLKQDEKQIFISLSNMLGNYYINLNNYVNASKIFYICCEYLENNYRRFNLLEDYVICLQNLGFTLKKINFEEAVKVYKKILFLLESIELNTNYLREVFHKTINFLLYSSNSKDEKQEYIFLFIKKILNPEIIDIFHYKIENVEIFIDEYGEINLIGIYDKVLKQFIPEVTIIDNKAIIKLILEEYNIDTLIKHILTLLKIKLK